MVSSEWVHCKGIDQLGDEGASRSEGKEHLETLICALFGWDLVYSVAVGHVQMQLLLPYERLERCSETFWSLTYSSCSYRSWIDTSRTTKTI